MDRNSGVPQQREMVYCHECENEWYRDEHGLVCPECQSDFTEIIEANQDPRMDNAPMSPEEGAHGGIHEWFAPDPEEDDIDRLGWQHNLSGQVPGQRHMHGTFTRSFSPSGTADRQQQGQGQPAGGLLGLLGTMFGNVQQQYQHQQQQQQQHQPHPPSPYPEQQQQQNQQFQPQQGRQSPWHPDDQGFRSQTASPGSNTVVRHASGPNYSVTFTTTTSSNLHPRNANSPQPFQTQPDNLEQLLGQMFMNIGAMQGHGFDGRPRVVHGGPLFMNMGEGTREGGGDGGGGGMGGGGGRGFPFGDLLSFLMPPGGVHGDAVYSQDAFDRIVTQLMEQHQSGNAPGPATEDAIESLPTRSITATDQGDSGKAECSICMDEAALGTLVTVLPCEHWFHHECIKAWLSEHDTCPHCRRGIMAKDDANTSRPRQPSQAPLHDMHSPEYQLPQTPGGFPFGRQDSAEASGSSATRSPPPPPNRSGSGMFSRMREAFGSGGGNSGGNQPGSNEHNAPR